MTLKKIYKKFENEHITYDVSDVIVSAKTQYQNVEILNTVPFGVTLFIDDDPQSSELDDHIYHESLVHPSMILSGNLENILICGGGEGSTLREVLKYKSVKKVTMIDIDEQLVSLCKKHMQKTHQNSFDDNRVSFYFGDARKYLEENQDIKFDCVLLDLTMPQLNNLSSSLFTKEFFEIVRNHLTPNGTIATEAQSIDVRFIDVYASIIKTMQSVFNCVIPYSTYIPLFSEEWEFVMALNRLEPSSLQLTKKIIDSKVKELNDIRYYDGTTHNKIFSLGLDTRTAIVTNGRVMTDDNPKWF